MPEYHSFVSRQRTRSKVSDHIAERLRCEKMIRWGFALEPWSVQYDK